MVCLIDFSNLRGRSRVMKSTLLVDGVEYDASFRDACLSVVSSHRADMFVFCLDGHPVRRYGLLPTYKEGRRRHTEGLPPYPLWMLVEDIREVSVICGRSVAFALFPFQEADDVIASIVRGVNETNNVPTETDSRLSFWVSTYKFEKLFLQHDMFCILSNDSDLQQLIRDDEVKVSIVSKMNLSDPTFSLTDKFLKAGVRTPEELLAYKVFEGDYGSDRIPRSRIVRPSKCGDLFWRTLNTKEKLLEFYKRPETFPELVPMVDIDLMRINVQLVCLFPDFTPYFYIL